MKKLTLFALCIAASAFVFTGCDKDKDKDGDGGNDPVSNTINVEVKNGSTFDIDQVRVTDYDEEKKETVILASAAYNKGKFSLTLPAVLDSKYQYNISEANKEEPALTFSDTEAMTSEPYVIEAYKGDKFVGNIFLANNADPKLVTKTGSYIYADRSIKITGEYIYGPKQEYKDKFNVSLAKGWNILNYSEYNEGEYEIEEYTSGSTSGLSWYFFDESYFVNEEDDADDYVAPKSLKR